MIYLELSTSDEKNYIERLYKSFATGRDFELFLNHFFEEDWLSRGCNNKICW